MSTGCRLSPDHVAYFISCASRLASYQELKMDVRRIRREERLPEVAADTAAALKPAVARGNQLVEHWTSAPAPEGFEESLRLEGRVITLLADTVDFLQESFANGDRSRLTEASVMLDQELQYRETQATTELENALASMRENGAGCRES